MNEIYRKQSLEDERNIAYMKLNNPPVNILSYDLLEQVPAAFQKVVNKIFR